MSPLDAIIFDLDGTLWDATGCAADIWKGVLAKHPEMNITITKQDAAGYMGKTMEEIGDILFPHLDAGARNALMEEFGEEEVRYLAKHGAILYPDVPETLRRLSELCPLYIVSNCQDGYVDSFFTAHRLGGCFRDIEMSGRTGLDKGSNIRMIMARNGITRAVYVGDTRGDEQASRKAGIPFIHAAYGFGTADAPDAVIHGIAELPACIDALRDRF